MKTTKQKRIFLSIACLCLALFISGCGDKKTSKSEEKETPQKKYEPEKNFVVENNEKECTITGYKGNSQDLNIPSKIGGRTVTQIGEDAFKECKAIVNVDIPDTVKKIGNTAFAQCSSLKSVIIPKGVTEIGSFAFSGCLDLESVIIPNTVKTIRRDTFSFSGLKSVTIPEGVTYIEESAFLYCDRLESVTIPKSVTEIGRRAFHGCSSLKEVKVPSECRYESESFDKDCKVIKN